jgi:Glycosyl hydrolase catalytic core
MTRRAIVLAGLILSLLVPSTAGAVRSEFFGVVQIATLDNQDIGEMAIDAQVRTNRFLLKWGWVQPSNGSSYQWGPPDKFIGRLAFHGIRVVPAVWGNPAWVAGSGSTPPIGGTVAENAWRTFLKALVGRYGPGGSYWTNGYRQRYGADARPWPIQSWQIWNEPNLQKYFTPEPSPGKYARLVQISNDAIKSKDLHAKIVLAGLSGNGDISASNFLNSFYGTSGIKNKFDVAALHPYASTLDRQRQVIQQVRTVMKNRADATTPLWLTELAWGSAPADGGLNKGPTGQAQMLSSAYKMILQNRTAWNVQRLFWYHWRDPLDVNASCTFCATAGLVNYDHTKKPAYYTFRGFTAENTPPQASITGGPGITNDTTPSFTLSSTEPGSTFVCRIDAGAYKPCSSPYTTPALADGNHAIFVKAIDAPGNESRFVWRGFTVDTLAPPAPRITDTDPNSPANDNAPEVKGTAQAGTTVRLYKTAGCTGAAAAVGSAAKFASPGITATVADNTTTSFRAKATDAAGNVSACWSSFTYVEDSTP